MPDAKGSPFFVSCLPKHYRCGQPIGRDSHTERGILRQTGIDKKIMFPDIFFRGAFRPGSVIAQGVPGNQTAVQPSRPRGSRKGIIDGL